MDSTSLAAREVRTWFRKKLLLEHALCRKESLAQRQRHLIVGQWRARRGILLAQYFGSLRILFPNFAWKDSSLESSVEFRHQNSAPYISTGKTHVSTRLLDDRGLRSPWKAPSSPWAKNAPFALDILSSMDFRLEESAVHQIPRHLTSFSTLNVRTWVLSILLWSPEITIPHLSGQRERPLFSVYDCTRFNWDSVSVEFVDAVRMSSACANAPRYSPLIFNPISLAFRSCSKGSITRLNREGERTEPWRIPLSTVKGAERWSPSRTWLERLEYQSLISLQHFPFTPAWDKCSSKTQNSTVSKAQDRS